MRTFLARRRRVLVLCLLVAWLAGATCFLVGLQSLGLVVGLASSLLELVVFFAVPSAAAAGVQFDGSYAAAASGHQEPVDAGPRPPAEIRPR